MDDLFVFDVVGHLATIADSSFYIVGAGEMPTTASEENKVEGTAVIFHSKSTAMVTKNEDIYFLSCISF